MRASGRVTIADDVLGGRIAAEHLLRLGHRRIGFAGDEVPDGIGESLGFVWAARPDRIPAGTGRRGRPL
jgi:DNA-binding LacI/PurR family transcriptional regulator